MMNIRTKDGKEVTLRRVANTDSTALYDYLRKLSAETRSRFGPHPFDFDTVCTLCNYPLPDIVRHIAIDPLSQQIIAYMLIKEGMIEWDQQRYTEKNLHYNSPFTVTLAPSVADEWQSSGLGTLMYNAIENELRRHGFKTIILWGGVQASNTKAVNFYNKLGYQFIGSFWHDGKDNYDMIKLL